VHSNMEDRICPTRRTLSISPARVSHPLAWAPFVLAGEGGAGR
jgi:hypothetical protein